MFKTSTVPICLSESHPESCLFAWETLSLLPLTVPFHHLFYLSSSTSQQSSPLKFSLPPPFILSLVSKPKGGGGRSFPLSLKFRGWLWLDQFQTCPSRPGICRAFFPFSFPTVGHLIKKVSPGVEHCQKQLGLSDLKIAYGSTRTCANTCSIVSTCQREMTKRRTCTVREKVAV